MPRTIQRALTHPFFWICALFILQLSVHLHLSYRPYWIAPPNNTYTVLGKNFYYPSMIYQAKEGAWGIIDTHTTRPTPRVYTQLFFVALGKVAAIFDIHPVAMYQLSQIMGGLFVFLASYWAIRQFVPKRMQPIAVIAVLGVETGPLITDITGSIMSWPPSFESHIGVLRHFGLPHHTWGEGFGLLFLGVLYQSVHKPSLPRAIGLFLLALITTSVLPPYMITLGLTVMAAWVAWSIFHRSFTKIIGPFALTALTVAASGLWVKLEFAKGSPWTDWTAAEKSWWTHQRLIEQYGASLLLYYPFILLCLLLTVVYWKTWQSKIKLTVLIMTAWVLDPFLYIPLSHYAWFPVANFRLTDGYQYFPAGVLVAIGLWQLHKLITNKAAATGIIAAAVAILTVSSSVLGYVFIKQQYGAQENFWSNIYPLKSTWQGVLYMEHLPAGSGVLVREYMGEILPAFGNIRVMIGGPHGFPDWGERQWLTNRFFSGELSEAEARTLLSENDIDYVFFGPDERALLTQPTLYTDTLIKPVYTTATVTIYEVQHR